jgi:DNA-binding PucR family transcriptional regulator
MMTVTVADCLKLSSLRESKVLSGIKGLNKIVTDVTVLEYANCSVLVDGLFIGNEIVITAFVSIKDDVEEQCKVIRRLCEAGEVAIILYYVGIFVPKIDEKLLSISNELDFPIICMPQDRFDFRYSEVISQIYELIFKNRLKETYFVSGMIERISQLREPQLNIDSVLRMLSDRMRCSLLLTNHKDEQIGSASWPMAYRWDYNDIIVKMRSKMKTIKNNLITIQIKNSGLYILRSVIPLEGHRDLELIAIDEINSIKENELAQAAEVIQLFLSIWKYDICSENRDALVQAILKDEPTRMRYISKLLNFDIESINTMWILKDTENYLDSDELIRKNNKRLLITKMFLEEYGKLALVDIYGKDIVVFMDNPSTVGIVNSLVNEFLKHFFESDPNIVIIVYQDLSTTIQTRESYLLSQTVFDEARLIYPKHHIIGEHELRFAKNCLEVISRGEIAISKILDVLKPLNDYDDSKELIETLSSFFLDSQKNMQITGDYLFLHKNTVKYRINKIKQLLGYDISKMPEAYELYTAVAINRLTKIRI